ncbi:MAG: pentapeptide repeat-containing protein [Deltaproteobacteria bacterium]|nr:pentapeptide repeat-containing protein [Deltaproteobacteria bacterium]
MSTTAPPGEPGLGVPLGEEASLRGVDLGGRKLSCISLRGADLTGAVLRDVSFEHVDLRDVCLVDSDLSGSRLRWCNARGARLDGASAPRVHWDQVDFTLASLQRVNLASSLLSSCVFEDADLSGVDLRHGKLVHSNCDRARFADAECQGAITPASTFGAADLRSTRHFARCREMVAEVLSRHAGESFELNALVGAVAVNGRWCYDEWAHFLASRPDVVQRALDAFTDHPRSGFAESLRRALRPPR